MGRIRPRFKTDRFGERANNTLPKFSFDWPEGYAIIRDTREQGGLFRNPPTGLVVISRAVPILGLERRWADYSLEGFEDALIAEMKEVDDLWSSVTVKGDSFKEKLTAMSKYESKYLIINGTYPETICWREHRDVHPNAIRQALASIEGKIGVPIHFGSSIQDIERWFLSWTIKFFKFKRGL